MNESADFESSGEIVATAGTYYRNARYLIVAMSIAAGLWFAYDGWVRYPAERARFEAESQHNQSLMEKPHTELDIRLQKRLACTLVPLGPLFLVFFLYRSRGAYRLKGETLYVPGHPPVPLPSIVEMDKSNWERKGVARIFYELTGAERSKLTLDDFVYQQAPTDKIVNRIEAYLQGPGGEPDASTGPSFPPGDGGESQDA